MQRVLPPLTAVIFALGCSDVPLAPVDGPLFAKKQGTSCHIVVDSPLGQGKLKGKKFRVPGEIRAFCNNGNALLAVRGPGGIQGRLLGADAFDRGNGRARVVGVVLSLDDLPPGFDEEELENTVLYVTDAEWEEVLQLGQVEGRVRVRDYSGFIFVDLGECRVFDGTGQIFTDGFESGDVSA